MLCPRIVQLRLPFCINTAVQQLHSWQALHSLKLEAATEQHMSAVIRLTQLRSLGLARMQADVACLAALTGLQSLTP